MPQTLRKLSILVLLLLANNTPVIAQTFPSTQDTAPSNIADLIKQLGSDQWRDRQVAQQKLVDIGGPAMSALTTAAQSDGGDPEIKSRAAAALEQIKERYTSGPTSVTLHFKDAPLKTVLEALSSQARGKIVAPIMPGAAVPTITIDVDQQPFWQAMEQICKLTDLCPLMDERSGNVIRMMPSQPQNWLTHGPHQIIGPFIISVIHLHHSRNLDLSGTGKIDDQFGAGMMIEAEPKIILTQVGALDLREAKDDNGNSLVPQANGMNPLYFPGRNFGRSLEVQLRYPANPGKKIAVLKGSINVGLGEDIEQYELEDVLGTPKVIHALPGRDIAVTVGKPTGENYQVNITLRRGGLTDEQWQAMISHVGDISLEDSDGQRLSPAGSSSTFNGFPGAAEYVITARFNRNIFSDGFPQPWNGPMRPNVGGIIAAKTGEPRRLKWEIPLKVKSQIINFEFHDLPMP